jgi:hypothetical protein
VLGAAGGLGVHDRHQPGVAVRVERLQEVVVGDGLSPVGVHGHDLGAQPTGDLHDPLPEEAVDADDRGVPGLQQMGQPRLHPGGAGRL